ncbi:MAG: aspartyl protease family protein, partial [Steroidobacteraceae bacterium]
MGVISVASGRTRRGLTSLRTAGRGLPLLLSAVALLLGSRAYAAGCTLGRLAELPVTMNGTRPMVHAKINGRDAVFLADSGMFYSSLTPATAAEFKLSLTPAPFNFIVRGVGGETRAVYLTKVNTFTIFDLPVPNVDFLVLPNDMGEGVAGLLGQNVFRIADVEYDLANGVIRFIRPKDCKNADLAYWVAKSQPYSVIDIDLATPTEPHTVGVAYLNGSKIHVIFDTGAAMSALTPEAAKRAGVSLDGPGVDSAGYASGLGRNTVKAWIAPFASFKIGDEEIRNTRLSVAELGMYGTDMLIGADFFLSHRVYVASSQRKLYFTYNGGPVFNLGQAPAAESAASAVVDAAGEPIDAAGFARRGVASAARHDYAHAIADLTRACELAPTEASYFYERGLAHGQNKEP